MLNVVVFPSGRHRYVLHQGKGMEITRVKGNTFVIDTGMLYLPFYKLGDHEIVLLDSGWSGDVEGIQQALDAAALNVVGIICSHAHPDHIGNNAYFRRKAACTIAMPRDEAFLCSSLANLKIYYDTAALTMGRIRKHYSYMVCETDLPIADTQRSLPMAGAPFGIIHIPGHSSAQIGIVTPDDVAYLADGLISRDVMKGAKVPFSFILKDDLESKSRLHDLECGRYILAHKGIFTEISSVIEENIAFYKERASRILELVDDKLTMEQILQKAVKSFAIRITNPDKYDVIFRMVRCYVEYLLDTDMIMLFMEDGLEKFSKS
jgi:glyoxylase-like metal-dependent hydrolase (beta-lactamase superfamily II)